MDAPFKEAYTAPFYACASLVGSCAHSEPVLYHHRQWILVSSWMVREILTSFPSILEFVQMY